MVRAKVGLDGWNGTGKERESEGPWVGEGTHTFVSFLCRLIVAKRTMGVFLSVPDFLSLLAICDWKKSGGEGWGGDVGGEPEKGHGECVVRGEYTK